MQRTRWQSLLSLAAVTALATWLLLQVLAGQSVSLPPVPLLVIVVLVVIAGVVFTMGWAVRQFLRGKRPNLDPIRAARTAVLAKASAYTGSLLTGWYAGQVLLMLGDLDIAARRERAIAAGFAALAAVLLAVVGLVVEHFCQVPPPTDKPTETGGAQNSDPAAA